MGHCTKALFAGEKFKTPFFSFLLHSSLQTTEVLSISSRRFFFLPEFITTGRFLDKTRSPHSFI